MSSQPKEVKWIGSSREDLCDFPEETRREVGFALRQAQNGGKHPDAKPFKGIAGGASVLEIVENFDTNTYRAVYTVAFEEAVYVLHCFMKKAREGKKTPRQDVDLIDRRFKQAQEEHKKWLLQQRANEAIAQAKRKEK